MTQRQYSRILVVQLRHIGDVLLTTPAVRALRRAYPDATIDFLVEQGSRPLLVENPHLDGILVRRSHESLWNGIQLLLRIRRNRYDLVVDFQHKVRTGLIAWFSGADLTVSYRHSLRRHFYTPKPSAKRTRGYMGQIKLALLRDAGVDCDMSIESARPEMSVSDSARAYIAQQFVELGLFDRHPLVSIDPMSRRPLRRWNGFAELSDRIVQECGARVIFPWGPGEREQVQAIADRCRIPPFLAPPTNLDQLAALLECCDLHIGNDSGPRHIAVARRTPTLTVLVQPTPETWTFPDGRHRTVVATPIDRVAGPDGAAHRATVEQLVHDARELIAAGRGA